MTITVGGSNITFPDSTTQTTAFTGGGVTSAVAGNGVAVSASTGAVTFSASCPTFNTVGSYVFGGDGSDGGVTLSFASGSNYAAGTSRNQIKSASTTQNQPCIPWMNMVQTDNLSGTWKCMGAPCTYTLAGRIYLFLILVLTRSD